MFLTIPNQLIKLTYMVFRRFSKDHLIKKLNYMIHLLEKQEDEKTSNVKIVNTEELVYICCLGVFTIFCVDSFA